GDCAGHGGQHVHEFDDGLRQILHGQFGVLARCPSYLPPNAKVSDGRQPPMTFVLAPQRTGWLPLAGPPCWLMSFFRFIQYSGSRCAWAMAKIQTVSPIRI